MENKTTSLCDGILSLLHLCEEEGGVLGPVSASTRELDGVIPIDSEDHVKDTNEVNVLSNDGKPAQWPINIMISYEQDDFTRVQGLKSINSKDARKMGASKFSSFMACHFEASFSTSGKMRTGKCPVSLLRGTWIPAAPWVGMAPGGHKKMNSVAGLVPLLAGTALTMRYEWSVWIGFGQGPRVRLISDPTGAMEVFKLRDVPEGRQRRVALRNWVDAHWRKHRKDPDASTWIKEHLRGATDFSWNGMRCRIQPPEYETELLRMK